MAEKSALLVVDLQNDFMPGGALGVLEGNQVVPVMTRYMERFQAAGLPIYLSRDWHPAATKHFQPYGGVWPPHCIQGTLGAEFHPGVVVPAGAVVVGKGMDPEKDSYSAFDAVDESGTPLGDLLRRRGVERLYIGGLATDYCVKWSALQAGAQGFGMTVLIDGCLGVNLQAHDSERAIVEMVKAGAHLATLESVRVP